jgi:hypothetical protein
VQSFTRARTDLVHERTRVLQRLEKLLEDAMVKITSVVSDGMKAKSAVAMVAALVAGERDRARSRTWPRGRCAASGTPSPRRWTACSIPITG